MSESPDTRPNVVVVFTDQQSATMLSCAGNEYLSTPAMDRLAATGTRFERAYCTNPVCSPSRFSLVTGRFPSEIGVRSNDHGHLDSAPEAIREGGLGHCLREAGYETAYAGKNHLPRMTPEDLGFDYITDDERDGLAGTCADYVEADHEDPFLLVASPINPHDICYMAIGDYREATPGYEGPRDEVAEATLEEALRLPDGVDREAFFAEHCPPLPSNHEPQADEPEAIRELLEQRPFRNYVREEWSDERWRRHRWAYCRLTEFVDAQIGEIVDALERSGRREETVVVFTSDHGDMDGAHRLEHKTMFYEESARIPFVVSQPGTTPAGAVDDEHLVSNGLDLLPTVCDYAGVEPPAHCAGRSVRPLAEGAAPDADGWRTHVRIENQRGEALVTDRYKYAAFDGGADREQLYDLREDPGEMRNAASDPGNEAVVARLRDRLRQARPQ